MPREKIYHTIETMLAEDTIYLSDETLNDHFFYLDVENVEVVFGKSVVGSIENIRISPWLVMNSVSLSSFKIASDYRLFFPGSVEKIELTYALWNPLSVDIEGEGDFGKCYGKIDLVEQTVRVVFEPTQQLRKYPLLISKLHREEEGLVYESDF